MKEIEGKATFVETDVRYFQNVYALVEQHKPQVIYHLAAQSFPGVSWDKPQETLETNVIGTANLFEAIKLVRAKEPYDPTVVVACSSAAYGYVSEEESQFRKIMRCSPYTPMASIRSLKTS